MPTPPKVKGVRRGLPAVALLKPKHALPDVEGEYISLQLHQQMSAAALREALQKLDGEGGEEVEEGDDDATTPGSDTNDDVAGGSPDPEGGPEVGPGP
jgi:hypothetical protein